jgi:hypothetical protein
MHKCRRRVFHRGEVEVARRLAPRALDIPPGKAAVNGLIRDRIYWLAVGPRPFVPAVDSASPLARISSDCIAKMLVIARALPSSLFRALRSPPERGVGWCFGAIRTSRFRQRTGGAGDYSNEGQQPSSSWRPVRSWQVSSSRRSPTFFQTAWAPANRTASAFWISMVRPQR